MLALPEENNNNRTGGKTKKTQTNTIQNKW